jgi:flagellar motor component MotA
MRQKKWPALIKPSLLLEVAGHGAMGVAVGLAFAFVVTHIAASEIATFINRSPAPAAALLSFVGTCATTFGIGATLTGLVMTLTEDHDTSGRK